MTVGPSNPTVSEAERLQLLIDEITSMHQQQDFLHASAHNLTKEAGSLHHLAKAQRDRLKKLEEALRAHLNMPWS